MKNRLVIIVTLGILNALSPFTIDMYLPAFPTLSSELGIPVAQAALSVSIYFIGFALGQIFYGPLLDRFGRKPPLYLGLGLYILSSLGCMTATTFNSLVFFRFLSALGGCAASVGATAMVRDFFPAKESAKVFSMLMLVLSASPLLAPAAGSWVLSFADWRSIFAILAGIGFIDILLVAFVLPKVYQPDPTVVLRVKPLWQRYRLIASNRQFAVFVLAGSFSFAGLFVYVAGSPTIFMEHFKVSPEVYGGIFAFLAAGMIGGGQLNLLLVKKWHEKKVFQSAMSVQLLTATLFLGAVWLGPPGLYGTVAFFFVILLCAGITYPNAAAIGLAPFSTNVGSAAALLGFFQLGVGALISALVGLWQIPGSLPMATSMFLSSSIGVGILLVGQKRIKRSADPLSR